MESLQKLEMPEVSRLRVPGMRLGHPFQFSETEAASRDTKAEPSSICPSTRPFLPTRIRKSG